MRWSRGAVAIFAMLALGAAVRVLLQIPLHRWAPEADCVIVGFQAREILSLDPAVFVATGYRQGALASYFAALAALVVGAGRAALAVEVAAVAIVQLVAWWWAMLEMTGWKAISARSARLLLFIALPAPAVVYWGLYWPNGQAEILLMSTLVLGTAASFVRRGSLWRLWLFALVSGSAFWVSMVTLGATIPAVIWAAFGRRREMLSWRRLGSFAAGVLIGAIPWLAFNIRYGWVSLKSNWAVRPVEDLASIGRNLSRLASEVYPGLLATFSRAAFPDEVTTAGRYLGAVALGLVVLAVAVVLLSSWRAEGATGRVHAGGSQPGPLLAGVVIATSILFVGSAAGSMPGTVVRYVFPVALVWPWVFASAWERGTRSLRAVLGSLAGLSLAGFLWVIPWPWSAERRLGVSALDVEYKVLERLKSRGVDVVFGSFWEVYPLIFESRGSLRGSTWESDYDFLRFAEQLPEGDCKWAIVERSGRRRTLAESLGIRGEFFRFEDGTVLTIPAPASVPVTCRERLRSVRASIRR